MIKYYKLLDKLNRMEMSKEEFRIKTGVSSATIAKLSKNEYISLKAVDTFCKVLNCQPGDLLEYVPDDVWGLDNLFLITYILYHPKGDMSILLL